MFQQVILLAELTDSNSNGRSDTNILAIVNPKTNTVALISTPRDYYVEIQAGKNIAANSYDKLTHCGLYGSGEPAEPTSPSEWGWGTGSDMEAGLSGFNEHII